jgi:hypothetical protein
MGLKFDSVMSRDFSGMRPQTLIRPGICKFPVSTTVPRRFEFQKRSQFFIRAHTEAVTVPVMPFSNEDCSPARIHAWDAAPTPTGFAEIVSDDFQYFTCNGFCLFCSPHSNDKISLTDVSPPEDEQSQNQRGWKSARLMQPASVCPASAGVSPESPILVQQKRLLSVWMDNETLL